MKPLKGPAIRFVGALAGIILGELSSMPFLAVFERAINQRPEEELSILFPLYVIAITILFVVATYVFLRDQPLNTRTGLRFGFAFGLVIAVSFAVFLYTFTTHEGLYITGVFETFLANYTLAGLISGFLNQRFVLR